MKLKEPFNKLSFNEYFTVIDNHKKYTNFNVLGLYRSILENEKLSTEQKIEMREYSNKSFGKTYEFLRVKDPSTYFSLSSLGQNLSPEDERNFWDNNRKIQQQILSKKKIKHRNFGIYSKHLCGYESCPYNGMMIKQGSKISEDSMCFNTDKAKYSTTEKAKKVKSDRKTSNKIIDNLLSN